MRLLSQEEMGRLLPAETRAFPGPEHAYGVAPEEMERLKEMLAQKRAHA